MQGLSGILKRERGWPFRYLQAQNKVTDRDKLLVFDEKKTMYIRYFFDPIDRSYIEVISKKYRSYIEEMNLKVRNGLYDKNKRITKQFVKE